MNFMVGLWNMGCNIGLARFDKTAIQILNREKEISYRQNVYHKDVTLLSTTNIHGLTPVKQIVAIDQPRTSWWGL